MTLDLTDDEGTALVQLLHRTIDEHRYPLSARSASLACNWSSRVNSAAYSSIRSLIHSRSARVRGASVWFVGRQIKLDP